MALVIESVLIILNVAWWVVIAHALMSWLISFGVLDPRMQLVQSIWDFLDRLLHPAYSRIRAFMPQTGAIDLSPLVLIVGIIIIRSMLQGFVY